MIAEIHSAVRHYGKIEEDDINPVESTCRVTLNNKNQKYYGYGHLFSNRPIHSNFIFLKCAHFFVKLKKSEKNAFIFLAGYISKFSYSFIKFTKLSWLIIIFSFYGRGRYCIEIKFLSTKMTFH